jgi:hypothetical protein
MFLSSTVWWDHVPLFIQVHWGIAMLFTVVFVVQFVFSLIGSDREEEVESETPDLKSYRVLNPRNVVAFFTIYAWTVLITAQGNLNPLYSVVVSALAGVVSLTIIIFLYRLIRARMK